MSEATKSQNSPLRLSLSNLNEEMDRIYLTNGWSPPNLPSPPQLRRSSHHIDSHSPSTSPQDELVSIHRELQTITEPLDSVVQSVIDNFVKRATFGKKKYGTDLDRTDLSTVDWMNHAQEELMDGILYLEKLKQETKSQETKSQETEDKSIQVGSEKSNSTTARKFCFN